MVTFIFFYKTMKINFFWSTLSGKTTLIKNLSTRLNVDENLFQDEVQSIGDVREWVVVFVSELPIEAEGVLNFRVSIDKDNIKTSY